MERRGFFGTMFGGLVAAYMPRRATVPPPTFPPLDLTAVQEGCDRLVAEIQRLVDALLDTPSGVALDKIACVIEGCDEPRQGAFCPTHREHAEAIALDEASFDA